MLLSYLKLSLRLLARNPFFTFINVVGLSVGFAVFFVLWQYSQNELKSDQFHKDYEQIYRITTLYRWTDDGNTWQGSIGGFTNYRIMDIVSRYTNVIDRTDFFSQRVFSEPYTQGHGAKIFMSAVDENDVRVSFLETKVIYAEPNFFNFFSFPLILGSKQNVLKSPDAMVISENIATKYFGKTNPIGKTLYLNNTITLQVTGVFKNLPHNTHLAFDIVISTERIRNQLPGEFGFFSQSYLKLPVGTDVESLKNKVNSLSGEEISYVAWGGWKGGKAEIFLRPLKEVAYEALRWDTFTSKSKYLLYIFSVASLIILMMAWINHVNLTISSSSKRLKELAARRTVGARTRDFVAQFMVEAVIINIVSFLLALTLIQLLRSPADIFLQFQIPGWSEIALQTWIILISTLLAGILLTGSYLAIISLKRSPRSLFQSHQLKTNLSTNGILTIIQFTGTCILVIWVFAFNKQLTFVMNKDIGLNRDRVVVLDLPIIPTDNWQADIEILTRKATKLPGIDAFTVCSSVLPSWEEARIGINRKEGEPGITIDSNGGVDENFIPFYGIKLLAGRNFQADQPSDKDAILISRGAMLRLGFGKPEDAIGQKLFRPASEIIGVFEDYTLRPLIKNEEITYGGIPGIALTYKDFLLKDLKSKKISFRVESENFNETIEGVEKFYNSVFPGSVFNWSFLDDQINSQYQSDRTARNQIFFFSALAIGIACLGLLGMISNKVVEKTKEIGIRKVMGAELHQIAQILLNTTAKQIIIATVIGIPVAYYLTQQYLEKFSERITLQWWHFALPVLILAVIMFATIASVLWKAAKSNPVEALKYE